MEEDSRNGNQQSLEPVLQEDIPFRGHTITAVRLIDGRIAVVLRWICEILSLDPQGQVQRIQRTAAIADELLRVKVQPRVGGEKPRRGGGPQVMPVLTLRGFSPWILGINPNEVEEDSNNRGQAERIREMIIAYQVEAIDVLYSHFMQKAARISAAPSESRTIIIPATKPQEPGPEADDQELTAYYEDVAIWAQWKASQHAQKWRSQVQGQLESLQIQLESEKAVTDIIPDILARLGPPRISTEQQKNIRGMVKRLTEVSGIRYQTIYWELAQAFQVPRYDEILASQYPAVCGWFKHRMDAKESRQE